MTKILIEKEVLNDHINDYALDIQSINVSGHNFSFEWNKTVRSALDSVSVDCSVDEDLIFESDDYVDVNTYLETKVLLDDAKEALTMERDRNTKLQDECKHVKSLQNALDIAQSVQNELKTMINAQAETIKVYQLAVGQRPWWRIW